MFRRVSMIRCADLGWGRIPMSLYKMMNLSRFAKLLCTCFDDVSDGQGSRHLVGKKMKCFELIQRDLWAKW